MSTKNKQQLKPIASAFCLAIRGYQLLSLIALLHESLGMAHNRRKIEEPEAIE